MERTNQESDHSNVTQSWAAMDLVMVRSCFLIRRVVSVDRYQLPVFPLDQGHLPHYEPRLVECSDKYN